VPQIHQLIHNRTFSTVLLVLALLGVLFFGLRPKDYDFTNRVALIKGGHGLQFEKYGLAYTQPFDERTRQHLAKVEGFSVTLDFQLQPRPNDGFSLVLCLNNGDDDEQLIIGQWRTHIIAMNGDDYAHKRKVPRISFDMAGLNLSRTVLTLTSGKNGTRIYANGGLIKEKAGLTLKMPTRKKTRLILGNSPYGRHSWRGALYGLGFYGGVLSANGIDSLILYDFDKIEDGMVKDRSGNGVHLLIPQSASPIKKKILAVPWHDFGADSGFFWDLVLNFLGFVPLGFLLTTVLTQSASLSLQKGVLITILTCFFLSLCIEVAQAWMPSRSSSMLDLVMNTFGAGVGAGLVRLRRS